MHLSAAPQSIYESARTSAQSYVSDDIDNAMPLYHTNVQGFDKYRIFSNIVDEHSEGSEALSRRNDLYEAGDQWESFPEHLMRE